jgi:hypothetical protein
MRKTCVTVFAAAASLLIVSGSFLAHHANAVFDVGKKVTVKGTVTEWFWANPHCLLGIDVKGDDGKVVHWVAKPRRRRHPFGWSKQSFAAGDEVTLTIEPVRTARRSGDPSSRAPGRQDARRRRAADRRRRALGGTCHGKACCRSGDCCDCTGYAAVTR